MMPKKLNSSTTGILAPSNFKQASMCNFLTLQKCRHLVLVLEKVKQISVAQLCMLLRHCLSCLSMVCQCRVLYIRKSSIYRDQLSAGLRVLNMELILTGKRSPKEYVLVELLPPEFEVLIP